MAVRVLLDTHLLLWALAQPHKLPARAKQMIAKSEVWVSAASIWEISIKSSLGKLSVDPAQVLSALGPAGFGSLPVTGEHAAKLAELPAIHKDPFDRMLVAQAMSEPMVLLTNDEMLRGYGSIVTIA